MISVNDFIYKSNDTVEEDSIKCTIAKMTDNDIIKMRGNLKKKIANGDKGTIIVSYTSLMFSVLSFMNSAKSNYSAWHVACMMMIAIVIVVFYQICSLWKKSKAVKALNYLDGYEKILHPRKQ